MQLIYGKLKPEDAADMLRKVASFVKKEPPCFWDKRWLRRQLEIVNEILEEA